MRWQDAQRDISICEECVSRWRGRVTAPLQIGEIPDPPSFVKILIVGVAPTDLEGRNKGGHFYSSAGDNLRRGLFRLLNDRFAIPLNGLSLEEGNQLFHGEEYFFVHAGKTRPVGWDASPLETLRSHREGQQLSSLSRVEDGIFRFTREKSSHTIGVGTTIAIESRLSSMLRRRPVPSHGATVSRS